MTALLLALFYKDERMNRRQIMASMIAFLGLVLVVLNGQLILHLNPIGDALAFSAAVSWGLYSLLMKPLTNQYEPSFLTRKVFAYGLITIIPWFLLVQPLNANLSLLTHPTVWMNLLWLSLVASLTCFLMWNWVLPRLGIVKATNVVYLQSIFTMLVSFLILNERITWMAIVGTLTLIGGMYLINKFEKK